jgi:hypothetical protein
MENEHQRTKKINPTNNAFIYLEYLKLKILQFFGFKI